MIPSARIIDAHQKGDHLINQWVIADGFARCLENAVLVADLTSAKRVALKKATADVRAPIAALEIYTAAKKIADKDAPDLQITQLDDDGNETEIDNPERIAWDAATVEVANISVETLTLVETRQRSQRTLNHR